jgi:hypothetical protein
MFNHKRRVFAGALAAAATILVSAAFAPLASAESEIHFSYSRFSPFEGHALKFLDFRAYETHGVVECGQVAMKGEILSLSETRELDDVVLHPTNCTLAGVMKATMSEAKTKLILAQEPAVEGYYNGFTGFVKPVTISQEQIGCKITIEPTGNEHLGNVRFKNTLGTVIEKYEVTNITSHVSASSNPKACGEEGTHTNGTLTGETELGIEGGTLLIEG